MKKAITPDEKFLLAAYKKSLKAEDGLVDMNEVASEIGLRETAMKNIVKHLAQANFIRKKDENLIEITERGIHFVEQL